MAKHYYVYMMASASGTLYIGVTNDIIRRAWEHREGKIEGFTKQYGCKKLLYYEECSDPLTAIEREKQLKNWSRRKKELLIKGVNLYWRDLYAICCN